MRIGQAFPSKWLKAADLGGKEYTLTMQRVGMETFGDEHEEKPVLYFQGAGKGLMLNKTNAEAIAIVYGDETDAWAGKQVVVYPDVTQYQGRRVDCIRVRPIRQDGGATLGAGALAGGSAPIGNAPLPASAKPAFDNGDPNDIPW